MRSPNAGTARRATADGTARSCTGKAATGPFARKLSVEAARNNTTLTRSARRPSRRPSRNARTTRRRNYADALYKDAGATLDDLHEAVNTLEATERTARRVLGGALPITLNIEGELQAARAALHAGGLP